jgi:hypothetical protein
MSPDQETKNIDDIFDFHPWNDEKIEKGTLVRESLKKAYLTILENVPASPDRSAALRKLREARMDCNSAITHDGKY